MTRPGVPLKLTLASILAVIAMDRACALLAFPANCSAVLVILILWLYAVCKVAL